MSPQKWFHLGNEAKRFRVGEQPTNWIEGRVPKKTSKQLSAKRRVHKLVCGNCGEEFMGRAKQTCCSMICARKVAGPKAAVTMKERGTHAGWHYRKGETSYPEQYFVDVFANEGISGYVREKKVGRWFIDFAFEQTMIAVEVDGRQHDDRVEADKRKDGFLTSQGWKVIRVRWYNPRTQAGKDKLHPQVKALLEVLR